MNKQLKNIKGKMREEVKSKKFDNNQIKGIRKQVREGKGHYDKHGNPIY